MRHDLVLQDAFLTEIRTFLKQRSLLEVHTACLRSSTVPDANIASVLACGTYSKGYLQTSPEYAMKQLLASGSGDIFQIAHAFRDDAKSQWHRCEFLMLEWYRQHWDDTTLLEEVRALLLNIHAAAWYEVSICYALEKMGWLRAEPASWLVLAQTYGLQGLDYHPLDALDFLVQTCVYHAGKQHDHWIVYKDFPSEIPGYARCDGRVQRRFEVYYGSLEIANGCWEENQYHVLKKNLELQVAHAMHKTGETMMIDEAFLKNASSLSCVSGVAIGLDRLYSLHRHKSSLCSMIND